MKFLQFTHWDGKRVTSILFLIGTAIILGNFTSRLVFPYDYRMFEDDGDENLIPGQPIVQNFVAQYPNLAQINLLLGNLEKIQSGEKLTISILDAECQETLRVAKQQFPEHAPKQFDRFTFEPIPDSAGKTYCLQILYDAKEKRKSVPFVHKMKNTGNPSDSFTNKISSKVYPEQTLIFRPAYATPNWQESLAELNRRMSAYKATWLRGDSLFILFGGFLITTIGLVVAIILRRED